MSVELGLKAYRPRVESRMAELLPAEGTPPKELTDAMRYSTLAPGKRLRPILCIASCEALGGSPESALDAACALEFVHTFSLIHDDLPAIDNDDLRRGLPTCHVAFGEAMALLAGDALFALAFEILARSPAGAGGVEEVARQVGVAGVVGGEALDVLSENMAPNVDVLHRIHRDKTGALFQACCAIGGMCAGGSAEDIDSLRRYADRLGLAFQIADDVLNETATAEHLGKTAGSDRASGKMTYPALYGLERSIELAEKAVEEAVSALQELGRPSDFLIQLAQYAVARSR